jgi:integrase/recombinase XerD
MKTSDFSEWVQRFFQEYLSRQRNVSPATVAAYRDTFRLLLQYWRQRRRQDLATLAALRSFVHYLTDWLGPELPTATRRILTIPFKRQVKPLIGFLTRAEIEAILAATDDTWTGRRDHLLILLLYNTGARISELLALRVQDVLGPQAKQVELQGKGRKRRTLPLWRQTQRLLRQWIRENRLTPLMPLLPNRYGEPLTRFGAFHQIKKLVRRASMNQPTLNQRPISPHLFRHASAMCLLEAGIAPEVIALWLGHETFNTTHQYVEANLAMKKQALEKIVPPKTKARRFQPTDKLLQFLESL